MRAEDFGEIEKLPRASCESSKLREDEGGDMSSPDVLKHPLRFGMLHDGFA